MIARPDIAAAGACVIDRPGLIATLAALVLCASCATQPTDPARALHECILTLDTHLDTPLFFRWPDWDLAQRHSFAEHGSQVDYPRMVEGGLDGGFWAIYTPQGPRTPAGKASARDAALMTAVHIRERVAAHPDRFALAYTADDAERIVKNGRRVVYLSIENGYPLGDDPTLLRTFQRLGVRMFGLVHTRNNDLADSSTDAPEWNGLSPFGKQLVVEANRLGLVLDASHASDAVLEQLIELSQTPVILSHSSCKAIFDHPRNIDDRLLRQLAASGGVIQINSLDAYLAPLRRTAEHQQALKALMERYSPLNEQPPQRYAAFIRERDELDEQYDGPHGTFDDFMRHVLHALEVAGPEHVGIGADWDGGGGVTGMSDVAAIPRITARLLQAGYTEAQIAQIWSGNVLRLLRQAEEYAAATRAASDSP